MELQDILVDYLNVGAEDLGILQTKVIIVMHFVGHIWICLHVLL